MLALAERVGPVMTPEKGTATTHLYNRLVMGAPEPSFVPDPSRIDRDFKRIGAMTKNAKTAALVGDTVAIALADSAGIHQAEFVHQLGPVTDSFRRLNAHLGEKMRQPARTVGVMVDSLEYLQDRGLTDPSALDTARGLLSSYAETMIMYDPNLRDNPALRDALTQTAGDALLDAGIDVEEIRAQKVEDSRSVVVDRAQVHKKREGDPTIYTIHKIKARQPLLIFNDKIEREGATAAVEVLTSEGQPLEYSMTLLVQNPDGEWRPVHLAPPVAAEEFHPKRHLDVQQKHLWTTDLPRESGKYAVVVESTPWHVDSVPKEEGSIYASLEQGEETDRSTDFLISAARLAGISLSSIFFRDGAHEGEVRVMDFGAKSLLNKLRESGYTDVLDLPVARAFKGRKKVQRTGLSFSMRVGVPGNEGTVPLHVMLDGDRGQELFTSQPKADEVDNSHKTIKDTEQEKQDRSAIADSLGLDAAEMRSEIYFFDNVHTYVAIKDRMRHSSTMTQADAKTRSLSLQPMSRHESQGDIGADQVVVEVVPFMSQKEVALAIDRPMETVTLERLLADAADSMLFTSGKKAPQIRIQSNQIVKALAEEERIREEQRRRMATFARGGFDSLLSGGNALRSAFGGYGGLSTSFSDLAMRGSAEVGHSAIVGELPHIVTALTAELPTVPSRIPNRTRRKSLIQS